MLPNKLCRVRRFGLLLAISQTQDIRDDTVGIIIFDHKVWHRPVRGPKAGMRPPQRGPRVCTCCLWLDFMRVGACTFFRVVQLIPMQTHDRHRTRCFGDNVCRNAADVAAQH